MITVHFFQKARYTLVPMRKATIDALLLTAFILLLLVFTGMLFTSPWLILPIYALSYLLTVVLRLRQAARETTVRDDQEQSFEIGQLLYAGMAEPLQTAAYAREQSEEQAMELTSRAAGWASRERRTRMQQDSVQQTFARQEDRQHFIEEISALGSLAAVAGVAAHLLAELEVFKHQVEHLDASAWERKEVRVCKRNELVRLSIAVLRAFNAQSGWVEQGAVDYCWTALPLAQTQDTNTMWPLSWKSGGGSMMRSFSQATETQEEDCIDER
jgi:hypothetical protein